MTESQAYIELTIKRPGHQDITVRESIPVLLPVSEGLMSTYVVMSETMDRLHHRAAEAVEMSRRCGLQMKPEVIGIQNISRC